MAKKETKGSFLFVSFDIRFDNAGALERERRLQERVSSLTEFLPIDPSSFLSMFPFFVLFNKKLDVQITGHAILTVMPNLIGDRLDELFDLRHPCIRFTWDGVRFGGRRPDLYLSYVHVLACPSAMD